MKNNSLGNIIIINNHNEKIQMNIETLHIYNNRNKTNEIGNTKCLSSPHTHTYKFTKKKCNSQVLI